MHEITVQDLMMLCKAQVMKGNGNKKVLLSNDDEGNGYHQLFYTFTEDVAGNDTWGEIEHPDEYIILG